MYRGGLVSKAHGRLFHSTLGLRVISKKKKGARGYCNDASHGGCGQGGNNLKYFKDFRLNAKSRIWP